MSTATVKKEKPQERLTLSQIVGSAKTWPAAVTEAIAYGYSEDDLTAAYKRLSKLIKLTIEGAPSTSNKRTPTPKKLSLIGVGYSETVRVVKRMFPTDNNRVIAWIVELLGANVSFTTVCAQSVSTVLERKRDSDLVPKGNVFDQIMAARDDVLEAALTDDGAAKLSSYRIPR